MTKTGRPKSPVKMVRKIISIPEWMLIALKECRGSKYDYISGYYGILTDMLRIGLYVIADGNYDGLLDLAKQHIEISQLEKKAKETENDTI